MTALFCFEQVRHDPAAQLKLRQAGQNIKGQWDLYALAQPETRYSEFIDLSSTHTWLDDEADKVTTLTVISREPIPMLAQHHVFAPGKGWKNAHAPEPQFTYTVRATLFEFRRLLVTPR